jgi:hypothetical protein
MDMKYYDSDVESINYGGMESDNEPPKDEVFDTKLLKKYELKRIYKKILKVGFALNKPAKFDEIKCNIFFIFKIN